MTRKQFLEREKTYAEVWKDTAPVELPRMPNQPVRYLYGSKGLTKMLLFTKKNEIDNKLINQFMALNPKEETIETFTIDKESEEDKDITITIDHRRLVGDFQKALLKYRAEIYKFPTLSTKQKKRNLRKNKQLQNESAGNS